MQIGRIETGVNAACFAKGYEEYTFHITPTIAIYIKRGRFYRMVEFWWLWFYVNLWFEYKKTSRYADKGLD